MNKKELLDRARALNIIGRHEMTKDQLEKIVMEHSIDTETMSLSDKMDLGLATDVELAEVAEEKHTEHSSELDQIFSYQKPVKARLPSLRPRDETGKVVRRGVNLAGHKPYMFKNYYLDAKFTETPEWLAALSSTPKQVQGIIRAMLALNLTSSTRATIGEVIAREAIARGYVVSKIKPDILFAYYRRTMEKLGLIFSHYGEFAEPDFDLDAEHETEE